MAGGPGWLTGLSRFGKPRYTPMDWGRPLYFARMLGRDRLTNHSTYHEDNQGCAAHNPQYVVGFAASRGTSRGWDGMGGVGRLAQ